MQHLSYPGHLLSCLQYKNGFTCNVCGDKGHGNWVRCGVCNVDLHIACYAVNMAEEKVIQHPSHPGHSLKYTRYPHGAQCNACGDHLLEKGYRCGACDFDLHISCATIDMAEENVIQHPSHPGHWLNHVRYPRGYACDGCGENIDGEGYNCAGCNFDLHECCARAPSVLDQSFHCGYGKWVHFQMEPPGRSQMRCSDCAQVLSGFGYYCMCGSCDYALHPTCASLHRRAQADSAPPQPDTGVRHRSRRGMVLRGCKFFGKLAFGTITGDPTSIVGAFADLVVSNDV